MVERIERNVTGDRKTAEGHQIPVVSSTCQSQIEDALVPFESLASAIATAQKGSPVDANSRFQSIMLNEEVQRLMQWEVPHVDDLSDTLELSRGKVLAIRMDQLGDGIGLKLPVVAGLIVRQLMRKADKPEKIADIIGFIDGGSVNTGLAMGHYAQRLGLHNVLVTSHVMPKNVLDYVVDNSGGRLKIIQDEPTSEFSPEISLTKYFMGKMRDYPHHVPLFHSLHSWVALRPLGENIADKLNTKPDRIVLSLGAGATLGGIAVPVQQKFDGNPCIIINEHEECPLLDAQNIPLDTSHDFSGYGTDWMREPPTGKKTIIVGPHEFDLTQSLDPKVLKQIGGVARYSDCSWRQMASHCREKGLSTGHSGAANLYVSKALAEQCGCTVLTVIVEPLRDFYLKNAGSCITG